MSFINTLTTKYSNDSKALNTYIQRTEKSIKLTKEALAKSVDDKYIEGYTTHLILLEGHLKQFKEALSKI